MSEEMIIRNCAPTLAGLKTGNMFSCPYRDCAEVYGFLREWNIKLRDKGLRLLPLRFKDGKALIYVYRPARLMGDLQDDRARRLLSERGYCTESGEKCLSHLMKRLREEDDFPHEIGLFLGYPCEDVSGFIRHKAACAKCVGCWKVYGNADKAQKLFDRYKKCTRIYQQQWADGKPLTQLAVAR